eukprot:GHVR01016080.1.p1 GENE.GHVR01016080.1~~GHVR01016080.1.p1  ORF type:complete len:256 (+),score=51.40 GHVR01016080.1:24-791(+)
MITLVISLLLPYIINGLLIDVTKGTSNGQYITYRIGDQNNDVEVDNSPIVKHVDEGDYCVTVIPIGYSITSDITITDESETMHNIHLYPYGIRTTTRFEIVNGMWRLNQKGNKSIATRNIKLNNEITELYIYISSSSVDISKGKYDVQLLNKYINLNCNIIATTYAVDNYQLSSVNRKLCYKKDENIRSIGRIPLFLDYIWYDYIQSIRIKNINLDDNNCLNIIFISHFTLFLPSSGSASLVVSKNNTQIITLTM